ncbi:ribosome maturation factor RimP [Modestobacter sp. VKM Ac-2985]|uniref:ribosome maturation factor RimP n=1 Tax=Modestobacter sp. VKM Ac-2985 TaxID=3004139 RepID=UPI0022AB8642|nr:ribosome maturation factor RimP [Modestobacter sp. VKM Ac-2985]MCZ2838941.1 ribosome maturation factor RimP [Modestobacter sp. VKM Ac-2985]
MSTRGAGTADVVTAKLTGWVEPVVTAAGYDLEELVVRPAGQRSVVRVVIDRDAGVSLDDVAELSRALSEVFDAQDEALGRSPYVLEVTSPGVDRPLTLPRHWRRNVGRLVSVAVGPDSGREELTGRVLRVDDDGVVLAVEKGGTKKGQVRKAVGERTVRWAELGEARVQVEFTRPAGHRDAALVHLGDGTGDEHDEDEHDEDEHDDEHRDDEAHQDDDETDDEVPAGAEHHHEQDPAGDDATDASGRTGRPAPRRAPRDPRPRRGGNK